MRGKLHTSKILLIVCALPVERAENVSAHDHRQLCVSQRLGLHSCEVRLLDVQ